METAIGAICDMVDPFGYSHIYLPNVIQSIRLTDVMVGRAFPTIICDVYGEREKPLGLLTEAIERGMSAVDAEKKHGSFEVNHERG